MVKKGGAGSEGPAKTNDWNPALDESGHAFVWKMADEVFLFLNPRSGERILDVGCGTGQLTARISASGARVVGIDSSGEMIRQARANFPQGEFRVADVTNFSLGERFDAVFSNAALHWVTEPEAAIEHIAAHLKPGGRFAAEFGGKGNVEAILMGMRTVLKGRGLPLHNPWYFPSVGEYSGILERHGFEVRRAELVDRMTPLEEGENGIRRWIEMFGKSLVAAAPTEELPRILAKFEQEVRPKLYDRGVWSADYRRIRILAVFMGEAA
jgi:trans-aconitate 2-methyltransferase